MRSEKMIRRMIEALDGVIDTTNKIGPEELKRREAVSYAKPMKNALLWVLGDTEIFGPIGEESAATATARLDRYLENQAKK